MKARLIPVVLDVVVGLAAFAVFVTLDAFLHVGSDLRTAIICLAVLYLCAGLVRGQVGNAWRKGLAVSAGGGLVMIALFMVALFHTVVAIFVLTAVLFSVCGVWARQFRAKHSAGLGILPVLVPLAALVIIVLTAVPRLAAGIATRKTANPAPVFTVSRLDGSIVRSTDWQGRVAVVDYWATWCPACRRELPELEKLHARYHNNPDVVFWAVDVQQNGETPQKASAFFQKSGYTLPLVIDSQNSEESLSKRFAFEGFPALILMDRSGRVRMVHIGYDRSEALENNLSREIETLLRER
jgi:thiol-disulfide isomerase/thioredoxin